MIKELLSIGVKVEQSINSEIKSCLKCSSCMVRHNMSNQDEPICLNPYVDKIFVDGNTTCSKFQPISHDEI